MFCQSASERSHRLNLTTEEEQAGVDGPPGGELVFQPVSSFAGMSVEVRIGSVT